MTELINIYLIIIIIIILYIVFTSSESNKPKEQFRNTWDGYEIFDGNFPEYIMATVNKWGNIKMYEISYAAWHEPARNGKKIYGATNLNYAGGTSGLGRGILYDRWADIFKFPIKITDSDDHASYGVDDTDGKKNHKYAVERILPPNIYYEKDPLYLYRDQHGSPHVYKVFRYINPTGELHECCKDKTKDRKTCKPQYFETDIGSNCNKEMINYCQSSNNIFNQVCTTWCKDADNMGICKKFKNNFCNAGNNFQNNLQNCSIWAKNIDGGFGNVNTGVSNYCKNNLNDNKICSCFKANASYNLSEEAKKVKELVEAHPVCYSNDCTEYGYGLNTINELKKECPPCVQVMYFDEMNANNIKFKNTKQSCNSETKAIETLPPKVPIILPASFNITPASTKSTPQSVPLVHKKITPIELIILKIKKIFKL